MFINLEKICKSTQLCTDTQKVSFANLISFPNDVDTELYSDIFIKSDDIISKIMMTNTSFIVGGYIVKLLPCYQIIYLKHLTINPQLKSNKYGLDLINDITQLGLDTFGENFKGVISFSISDQNKKFIDKKNTYKYISLLNSGSQIVTECAKQKNNYLHFIFVPKNGGLEQDEVKEMFKIISKF